MVNIGEENRRAELTKGLVINFELSLNIKLNAQLIKFLALPS